MAERKIGGYPILAHNDSLTSNLFAKLQMMLRDRYAKSVNKQMNGGMQRISKGIHTPFIKETNHIPKNSVVLDATNMIRLNTGNLVLNV